MIIIIIIVHYFLMLIIYALRLPTKFSDRSSSCRPLTTTIIIAGIELPRLLRVEMRIAAAPHARIEGMRQHLAGSIEFIAIAVIAPAKEQKEVGS